jgi:SAM-dependent methyltransferase
MANEQRFGTPGELPPRLALFQLVMGHYFSQAIYVAARLGIADVLASGPRHYGEIAEATSAHAPSLHRLLRFLASMGVVAEDKPGCFALTPLGDGLRADAPGSFRPLALLFAGPLLARPWLNLQHSVQTGEAAFDRTFSTDFFQYLAAHPDEAEVFNDAMTAASAQVAIGVPAAYDFTQIGTIVDVGGGQGALLSAILKANPSVQGILYEMPHVVEGARQRIAAAGLAGRCEVVAGDFFQAVPAGADAYLLKSIIHDWDDARSATILRNCHRAMAPNGKLLLVEPLLPERITNSPMSQFVAGSDVNMMVLLGGRERTEQDFRALLESAGFRLSRIVSIDGTSMSVLESVRV